MEVACKAYVVLLKCNPGTTATGIIRNVNVKIRLSACNINRHIMIRIIS